MEESFRYVFNEKESHVARNKEGDKFYYWNVFIGDVDTKNIYMSSVKLTPTEEAKLVMV